MKIVVCVKQVPATHDVSIDPETKRLIREGVAAEINPFDYYAIEQGVRMREQHGGEVIVLTMGPPQAADAVREAIACETDRGILLSDRAFAGSDTWATSYALACAIRQIGGVDLVLCGKQAVDGDTAQVGPGIAAHLDWPQVTYVSSVSLVNVGCLNVRRMYEDGYELVEVHLPAVLTVVKEINTPRVPTLTGRIASLKADVPVLGPSDIAADAGLLGLNGSPTRVVKTNPPPPRAAKSVRLEGPSRDVAKRIVYEMRMLSLI